MTKNMTEGPILPLILKFSLPLLVGNLLQQTYNMADAAIVGRYIGKEALAGVGATSSVQFLVLGFCMGVCAGFSVPVAQRFGAKDYDGMRKCMVQGGFLTLVIALVLTAVCAAACPWILRLLKLSPDSSSEALYESAYTYLFVIFLGIPCSLLYNLLSGILRAVGDSRTPFIFLVISTVLNIGMDLVFILVCGWQVSGAALATVFAQGISGILCFFYIKKKYPLLHLKKEDLHLNGHELGMMAGMGIPMGLQFSITAIGSMVMQAANNGLNDVCVTAFSAGSKIKQFAMCPFDAISTGVATFCSQNLGAGQMSRIHKGIRQGIAIAVGYGLTIGLVLIFFGEKLVLLFLSPDATEEIAEAGRYLRCTGFFYWSLGFLNVGRLTVQGLGYSGRAIFSGVIEMAARLVVSLVFVPIFGYAAICFCDQSAWTSAAIYIMITLVYCLKKCENRLQSKANDNV